MPKRTHVRKPAGRIYKSMTFGPNQHHKPTTHIFSAVHYSSSPDQAPSAQRPGPPLQDSAARQQAHSQGGGSGFKQGRCMPDWQGARAPAPVGKMSPDEE